MTHITFAALYTQLDTMPHGQLEAVLNNAQRHIDVNPTAETVIAAIELICGRRGWHITGTAGACEIVTARHTAGFTCE